jgi:hypothetical protein
MINRTRPTRFPPMPAIIRIALFPVLFFSLPAAAPADDERPMRELNSSYFPMDTQAWSANWSERRERVANRVMLAAGLWPLPEKTPLNAVIHGRIERDDHTIDRVYFESFPGHYVTGSLYLPKPLPDKPFPAVLCPHGHWPKGRFMDAGADSAATRAQLERGEETFASAARSPLQARCVHLARMGCAAFLFDTLGNADSVQIPEHRSGARDTLKGPPPKPWGLYSAAADLRLQTNFGLQTWNSVRALDFLASVKGVDKNRLAVTGASGGATQTMMITAIDERVQAAFPCVMVSTAMQGGCTCENGHYLRVNQGNIDIAAAAAPRPLGLTTADDWTVELETKGYPDLRDLYQRIGKPENLSVLFANQFKHNYNQVSRAEMYQFMKKHLRLGAAPVVERDFTFSTGEDLTVWTAEHPAPLGDNAGEAHEAALLKTWDKLNQAKIKPLLSPKNENQAAEAVLTVGEAWRMIVGRDLPLQGDVKLDDKIIRNTRHQETVEITVAKPAEWNGAVEILLTDTVASSGAALVIRPRPWMAAAETNPSARPDTLEKPDAWNSWSGYTYGYNPPLLIRRVHDTLTVLAAVPALLKQAGLLTGERPRVVLAGDGQWSAIAGLAALIAGPQAVDKISVKPDGFRFASLDSQWHPAFVPGAVKYGDLPAILALCAPLEMELISDTPQPVVQAFYQAYNASDLLNIVAN